MLAAINSPSSWEVPLAYKNCGVLVNVYQPALQEKKALLCRACRFPWCKHTYHGGFQDTSLMLASADVGRDVQDGLWKASPSPVCQCMRATLPRNLREVTPLLGPWVGEWKTSGIVTLIHAQELPGQSGCIWAPGGPIHLLISPAVLPPHICSSH